MSASTSGATPLRTPMRDSLQINTEDGMSAVGDTPRQRLSDLKNQLRAGFGSLPQPKNEFELVLPEEMEDDEVSVAMRIEDATEREDKLKAIRKVEEEKALARRSQVVKRGLPRPAEVDSARFLQDLEKLGISGEESEDTTSRAELERLIAIEMIHLLEHDAITYPAAGGKRVGGGASSLAFIEDEDLSAAKALVHSEIATAVGVPGATDSQLRRLVRMETTEYDRVWKSSYDSLGYNAKTRSYVPIGELSNEDRIAGYSALIDENREKMTVESSKASKVEKKLGMTLGGYVALSKGLGKKLSEGYEELDRSRIELGSFERLATNEVGALARRNESLQEEVDKLEKRQREGQGRYRELIDVKRQMEEEIEEMIMLEAEALNDAANME